VPISRVRREKHERGGEKGGRASRTKELRKYDEGGGGEVEGNGNGTPETMCSSVMMDDYIQLGVYQTPSPILALTPLV